MTLRPPRPTRTDPSLPYPTLFRSGAAGAGGFKGLAGRHARNGLLRYGDATVDRLRLRRLDTGETVSIKLDASPVPVDPTQRQLLGLVLQGSADAAQLRELGRLWQERVRRSEEHTSEPPSLMRN